MKYSMLNAYQVDDITILYYAGRNKFNQMTYDEYETKAYIDWKTKLIRNFAGEETVATATVYLNIDNPVGLDYPKPLTHNDYIKINGVRHTVLNMVEQKDFSADHQEVYIA